MQKNKKQEYGVLSQLVVPTAELFVRSNSRSAQNVINLSMRKCIHAVVDIENICRGCKRPLVEHRDKSDTNEWSSEACTIPVPTNAMGKIKFPGSYNKTALYVRIDHKTEPTHFVKFLYDRNGWNLTMPQLIISVTGGAQKFTIPLRMRTAFKRGLVKAAASTNAWVITGGTNTGVMKLVGEAVSESVTKITVLGIASWGKIGLRDELVMEKRDETVTRKEPFLYVTEDDRREDSLVQLDPNHTHFILVDDGSSDKYGVEIKFRADLENELSKGYSLKYYNRQLEAGTPSMRPQSVIEPPKEMSQYIPNVLIVVQGGPNTLKTVYESVINRVPVLVLADSKGCADLVANAVSLPVKSEKNLEQCILDSKMFDKKKPSKAGKNSNDERRNAEALEHLKAIVADENSGFINVFRLDSGDGTQDIELTILRAFLNSRKNEYFENLKLALKWNRSDIAKNEIFNGEETFEKGQLLSLLEIALLENRPKFVEILLENRVNLISFLTLRRLYFLYNSEKVLKNAKKSPLYQLIDKSNSTSHLAHFIIKFDQIRRFCVTYGFTDLKLDFLPEKDVDGALLRSFMSEANFADTSEINKKEYAELNEQVEHPAQNLFLWALLHDRIEIAKIFWQIGQHQICNALFASALFRNMSKYLHDLEIDLLHHACYFETLAVSILNTFDLNTDNLNNAIILLRIIPFYNINCLEMAVEAGCKNFVAQVVVQALLTEIWNGSVLAKASALTTFKLVISYTSLGLMAPFLLFNNVSLMNKQSELDKELHEYAVHNDIPIKDTLVDFVYNHKLHKNELHKHELADNATASNMEEKIYLSEREHGVDVNYNLQQPYWTRFLRFMTAPRTRFTYDTISYIVFLLLFSYMMLCEFNYDEYQPSYKNQTNMTSVNTVYQSVINSPNWVQYLLISWVFSFLLEEFRQFFSANKPLRSLFKTYMNDQWNYLDMTGCLLFSIGMALRVASYLVENRNLFTTARILLCLDLCVWYVRLLHVSLVVKSLGPKLVMIRQMLKDLMFFCTIIAIFVCSFGVTTQATLYPRNTLNLDLFMNVIHKAYWPIYGEMKILDEDITRHSDECSLTHDCPESIGVKFSFFALMIYMVIANILLINLLIAMFSSTFQKVQANTDEIWKYQRYRLVFEYFDAPSLPQPLVIFSYIGSLFKMIFSKLCKRQRSQPVNSQFYVEDMNFRLKDQTDPFLEYEKRYAEINLRAENERMRSAVDNKLHANSEKLETLEEKLNEVVRTSGKELHRIHENIEDILTLLKTSRNY